MFYTHVVGRQTRSLIFRFLLLVLIIFRKLRLFYVNATASEWKRRIVYFVMRHEFDFVFFFLSLFPRCPPHLSYLFSLSLQAKITPKSMTNDFIVLFWEFSQFQASLFVHKEKKFLQSVVRINRTARNASTNILTFSVLVAQNFVILECGLMISLIFLLSRQKFLSLDLVTFQPQLF